MAWAEKYVSVAGGGAHDGSSEANAWTLAEAIAAPYAAGDRVNVKAGTYANTTTTRTFGVAGTTTAPIWWRGYNSTIGDLDADFTTAKPAITFTTGVFDITGSFHLFSNFDISGAQVTAGQVRIRVGTNSRIDRCRVECTSANSLGKAISLAAVGAGATRCWLKCTSSADVVACPSGFEGDVIGCAIINGADGISLEAALRMTIAFNTFIDQGANAVISNSGSRFWFLNNSVYSPAGDGINLITTIPALAVVANNIFSECGVYGINNATGANSATIFRSNNDFYASGTANETGFGDYPSLSEQTESSSPFTSSTNMTIPNSRNAIANGLPGLFENQSYTSYMDIGAVQRVEPSGGGGLIRHPGMTGGLNG